MVTKGTSRIASDFGFQLNLAPGKTEAVVSWVGPGSRPITRRLMALPNNRQAAMLPLNTCLDDDGDIQFPALAENDRAVRIVQAYRHLGTIVQAGAGMGRSHHVPTLDKRRSTRWQGGSWAMKDFHDTYGSRWPKHVWLRDVCTKWERGTGCKATSCSV